MFNNIFKSVKETIQKKVRQLKRKVRAWLLDEPYFIGVDYGYRQSCLMIIRRNKDATIEVISNKTIQSDKGLLEIENYIKHFAKEYNIPSTNILRDYPKQFRY